jgi:AsmA protein
MNRRRKLLAVIAGVPLLLVLLALVVAPLLVDSAHYKGKVMGLVEAHTGRPLHIDGALSLRLLPGPRLTVTNVRLGNPPGFTGPEFASLATLAVELEVWPLLGGRLETRGLELRGLVLNLERDARGRGNWQFATASERDPVRASPAAMAIGGLDIRGATLNWRDAATGELSTIANLSLETDAFRTGDGVDDVGVRAQIDDLAIADVQVDATLATRLGVNFSRQRLNLDGLRIAAQASDAGDAHATLAIETTLELDLSRQRLAETTLSVTVPEYAVSGASGQMALEGVLGGDLGAGIYTLKSMRSHGTVGGNRPPVRLDGDLVLAEEKRTLTATNLQLSLADRRVTGELTVRAGLTPPGLTGTFDLSVEEQRLKGSFAVADANATLDLQVDLTADLDFDSSGHAFHGRNDVAVRASVSRGPGEQRYRIANLQVDAHLADPFVTGGRLATRLRADVDVDLKDETVRSDNLRLDVHESRIVGSMAVRRFDAPALEFDLQADAIDADRLLPPVPAGTDDAARASPVSATINAIRALDATGEMRVGTLTFKGLELENVRLASGGASKN